MKQQIESLRGAEINLTLNIDGYVSGQVGNIACDNVKFVKSRELGYYLDFGMHLISPNKVTPAKAQISDATAMKLRDGIFKTAKDIFGQKKLDFVVLTSMNMMI